jgi:putative two-component system response regulator
MNAEGYVVVVDDDPDDLLLANVALKESGCRLPVRFVASGAELIHLLTTEHPETGTRTPPPVLILLDLRMPGISGRVVLERLRTDPYLAGVPIIAVSGTMDRNEGNGALSAGARAYVSKNLPTEDFRQAIRNALDICVPGNTSRRLDA